MLFRSATSDVDVLVVDDNSPDGTGRLADEITAREKRVRVLHRARKEGLGRAYLAAFASALSDGYELVVEMDAHFSHDPKYPPEMLARAEDADLVIGSRHVAGGGSMGWGLGRRCCPGARTFTRERSSAWGARSDERLQVLPPRGP